MLHQQKLKVCNMENKRNYSKIYLMEAVTLPQLYNNYNSTQQSN